MVALAEPHLSAVRTALGVDAESVQFADMASLGANPARILPAWLRFVEEICGGGRRGRGLGEPVWPGRRPAELAECHLHEALLNVALPPTAPLWLRCPYDAEHLGSAALHEVAAAHPFLVENGACRPSNSYGGPNLAETVFRSALPEPAVPTVELPLGGAGLSAVRDLVLAHAVGTGVEDHLADGLSAAVGGLAGSSLRYGAGSASVRVWREPEAVVCEVRDAGCIDDPLAGRRTAEPERSRGRALREANLLCDLVQLRSNLHGTAVRVHTWLPRSAGVGSTGWPPAAAVDSGSGAPAPRAPRQGPGYLRVLVSDLDGTLTDGGPVAAALLEALDRARARGVAVILVTGRRLWQLDEDHPGLRRHMDSVVLENGAVLLGAGGLRLLAPPVPRELTDALTRHGVTHHTGEVVVDCDAGDAHRVLDALADTGLDHQMVRNRAALMVLPAGVTKATGLKQALAEFGLGGHNAVAVGDAENDLRLFDACEIAVAVANAAPVLRAQADVVLPAPAGEGVLELLRGPLLEPGTAVSWRRWRMTLGHADAALVQLPASPSHILVTGDSGAGKSFLTGLIVEQLAELQYSALVIDPEGDHAPLSRLPGVMTIGRDAYLPPPGVLADLLAHGQGTLVLDLSQQRLGDAGPLRSDALAAVLRRLLHPPRQGPAGQPPSGRAAALARGRRSGFPLHRGRSAAATRVPRLGPVPHHVPPGAAGSPGARGAAVDGSDGQRGPRDRGAAGRRCHRAAGPIHRLLPAVTTRPAPAEIRRELGAAGSPVRVPGRPRNRRRHRGERPRVRHRPAPSTARGRHPPHAPPRLRTLDPRRPR